MKNRTAHMRWWAERIGRPGVVPSNGALGIANREYVTNEDKSVVLDPEKLALVKDEHVVMALRLEAEFGLAPRGGDQVHAFERRPGRPHPAEGIDHQGRPPARDSGAQRHRSGGCSTRRAPGG